MKAYLFISLIILLTVACSIWNDDRKPIEFVYSGPDSATAGGGYGCTAEPYCDWLSAGDNPWDMDGNPL